MSEDRLREEGTDVELQELFSSLNDVVAPEGLKGRTIELLLAALDEQDVAQEEQAPARDEQAPAREERASAQEERASAQEERASAQEERASAQEEQAEPSQEDANYGGLRVVEGAAEGAQTARRRRRVRRLRVAAAVVVALVGGGAVAYALPASHVLVESEGTTFDLGVNVFGMAVSADADSDEGKATLQEVDVRNAPFEDAFGRILDDFGKRMNKEAPEVSVEVRGSFADNGERFGDRARDILGEREQQLQEWQEGQERRVSADDPARGEAQIEAAPTPSEREQDASRPQGTDAAQGGEPTGVEPSASHSHEGAQGERSDVSQPESSAQAPQQQTAPQQSTPREQEQQLQQMGEAPGGVSAGSASDGGQGGGAPAQGMGQGGDFGAQPR